VTQVTSSDQAAEGLGAPDASGERRSVSLEISNAIVRIHKQFFGKGPTKARSHLTHDLLTVVLEGGFTRAEQSLHEGGHDAEVANSRAAMQAIVETEFRTAVEEIVGRKVRCFMSANNPTEGMSAEIFVLEPNEHPSDDGSLGARAERARQQHREILDEHRALRAEQVQSRRALHDERDRGD
jgi:uncharacterized protein YbcI